VTLVTCTRYRLLAALSCVVLFGCERAADSTVAIPAIPPSPPPSSATDSPFRASGNEPGWMLTLDGNQLVLLLDHGARRIETPPPQAEHGEDFIRYRTQSNGETITITTQAIRCTDTMTGMPHPMSVTLQVGERTMMGCGGAPASLLLGPEWIVEEIDGSGVIADSNVTLIFAEDGSVSGRASCNHYTANWALSGEGLRFTQGVSTRMACAAPLMDQEARFLQRLTDVERFTFSADNALVLEGRNGRIQARPN